MSKSYSIQNYMLILVAADQRMRTFLLLQSFDYVVVSQMLHLFLVSLSRLQHQMENDLIFYGQSPN